MKDWKSTSWTFENDKTLSILEVLDFSDNFPVLVLPIEEIIQIRTVSMLDPERIKHADLACPILIIEEGDRRWILDGNHRLQKAINKGYDSIKAKIIRGLI